jgi:hypothetical protein
MEQWKDCLTSRHRLEAMRSLIHMVRLLRHRLEEDRPIRNTSNIYHRTERHHRNLLLPPISTEEEEEEI